MKILVTAAALVLAVPAAAQTAPASQPQGHQQHQMGQHGQHQPGQHQPGQHEGHGMRDGCCVDRNNNGRMDCCENMAQGSREHGEQPAAPQTQPSGHQHH